MLPSNIKWITFKIHTSRPDKMIFKTTLKTESISRNLVHSSVHHCSTAPGRGWNLSCWTAKKKIWVFQIGKAATNFFFFKCCNAPAVVFFWSQKSATSRMICNIISSWRWSCVVIAWSCDCWNRDLQSGQIILISHPCCHILLLDRWSLSKSKRVIYRCLSHLKSPVVPGPLPAARHEQILKTFSTNAQLESTLFPQWKNVWIKTYIFYS